MGLQLNWMHLSVKFDYNKMCINVLQRNYWEKKRYVMLKYDINHITV